MFVFVKVLRIHFSTRIDILLSLLRRYIQLHIFGNQSYDILSKHARDVYNKTLTAMLIVILCSCVLVHMYGDILFQAINTWFLKAICWIIRLYFKGQKDVSLLSLHTDNLF